MNPMNMRSVWCLCILLAMSVQAVAQLRSLHVEMVYPRIEMGREIVVCMAYTNLPPGARRLYPFRFGKSLDGFHGEIMRGTNFVRLIDRVENSFPSDEPTFADANGLMVCDLILPKDGTPSIPGVYELRLEKVEPVERLVSGTGMVDVSMRSFKLPPLSFEVVSVGSPTPERPRPWEDYNRDPGLYPELKRHLVAMPMHRFGRAGLSKELWLEVFCDAEFPKERRIVPVESLLWHKRPYSPKLLPLALDEKVDEELRLRALMLLGGMEKNEDARSELVKRYWRKDDAGQKSALYRMAFLYGDGRGTAAIPYGTIDPSPLVRGLALFPLAQNARAQEVLSIAKSLTNSTANYPTNLFPDGEWMTTYPSLAAAAMDYEASAKRALAGKTERTPVPPPADAAEQADAVRKLFH